MRFDSSRQEVNNLESSVVIQEFLCLIINLINMKDKYVFRMRTSRSTYIKMVTKCVCSDSLIHELRLRV